MLVNGQNIDELTKSELIDCIICISRYSNCAHHEKRLPPVDKRILGVFHEYDYCTLHDEDCDPSECQDYDIDTRKEVD